MKKLILAAALALGAASTSHASPALMFGVSFNSGDGVGLSVNLLSSDRRDKNVATVGTSWYPTTNRFGFDAGVGRTFKDGAATVSWDFLTNSPRIGVGYVDTRR